MAIRDLACTEVITERPAPRAKRPDPVISAFELINKLAPTLSVCSSLTTKSIPMLPLALSTRHPAIQLGAYAWPPWHQSPRPIPQLAALTTPTPPESTTLSTAVPLEVTWKALALNRSQGPRQLPGYRVACDRFPLERAPLLSLGLKISSVVDGGGLLVHPAGGGQRLRSRHLSEEWFFEGDVEALAVVLPSLPPHPVSKLQQS